MSTVFHFEISYCNIYVEIHWETLWYLWSHNLKQKLFWYKIWYLIECYFLIHNHPLWIHCSEKSLFSVPPWSKLVTELNATWPGKYACILLNDTNTADRDCTWFIDLQPCAIRRVGPGFIQNRTTVHVPVATHTHNYPDSKVHGANMGPIWGRQDPGGPHVDRMNFAIWVKVLGREASTWDKDTYAITSHIYCRILFKFGNG